MSRDSEHKNRPNVIAIRLSDAELAQLDNDAAEKGVNRSQLVRALLLPPALRLPTCDEPGCDSTKVGAYSGGNGGDGKPLPNVNIHLSPLGWDTGIASGTPGWRLWCHTHALAHESWAFGAAS